MQINQFKAKYLPLADRVLLSLNSQKDDGFHLLLTRRVALSLIGQINETVKKLPNKNKVLNEPPDKGLDQKKSKPQKKRLDNDLAKPPKLISQVTVKMIKATESPVFNLSFFFQDKTKLTLNVHLEFLEKILNLINNLQEKANWDIKSNHLSNLRLYLSDKEKKKLH